MPKKILVPLKINFKTVLSEVRDGADGLELKIIFCTHCALCEVRTDLKETVTDPNIRSKMVY